MLQGKQPQELVPDKYGLFCLFIINFLACSEAFWTCSECWRRAVVLHSSAFLWTIAILFINFSSRFDLIFWIFTWKKDKVANAPWKDIFTVPKIRTKWSRHYFSFSFPCSQNTQMWFSRTAAKITIPPTKRPPPKSYYCN